MNTQGSVLTIGVDSSKRQISPQVFCSFVLLLRVFGFRSVFFFSDFFFLPEEFHEGEAIAMLLSNAGTHHIGRSSY